MLTARTADAPETRAILDNPEFGVLMTRKGLRSARDALSLRHTMEMGNRTQVLACFTGAMDATRDAFAKGKKKYFPIL